MREAVEVAVLAVCTLRGIRRRIQVGVLEKLALDVLL